MTGYVLMPEEATPEMEQAAEKYWNERKFKSLSDDPRTWKGLYAAMRAVAPDEQGEPVAWQRVDCTARIITVLSRRSWTEVVDGVEFRPLYTAPQSSRRDMNETTNEETT